MYTEINVTFVLEKLPRFGIFFPKFKLVQNACTFNVNIQLQRHKEIICGTGII